MRTSTMAGTAGENCNRHTTNSEYLREQVIQIKKNCEATAHLPRSISSTPAGI
ncbi:hypothetical protein ACXYMU_11225 [Pontibacter sp. CAU 1760]